MWYEFLVLPFGLATAPFVFTKLTYPVVAFLRAFGIRLIIFLDVMLVVGATEDECRDIVARVIQTLVDAGFRIYLKKSNLVPPQEFRFLGLVWNSQTSQISLSLKRFQDLNSIALQVRAVKRPSCSGLKGRFLLRSLSAVSGLSPTAHFR